MTPTLEFFIGTYLKKIEFKCLQIPLFWKYSLGIMFDRQF